MTLSECKDWKAVHIENRVILRTDCSLYPKTTWQALVSVVKVKPMKVAGHYEVI